MSHDNYKKLRPSNTVKQLGRALAIQLHSGPRRVQLSIHQRLLETPLDQLLADARAIRDRQFGSRVTYSPKVFIPLTMLCRDKCGYCTFAQPPARLENPYLSADQVLAIAKQGAKSGCHEALFTLGERPELRYDVAAEWLKANGFDSTVHYLHDMAALVLKETGLLPHANAGALYKDELAMLRRVSPSQGMMLESLRDDLECHRGAPDKEPQRRINTLCEAGDLAIPFTSGILVGIGEEQRVGQRCHRLWLEHEGDERPCGLGVRGVLGDDQVVLPYQRAFAGDAVDHLEGLLAFLGTRGGHGSITVIGQGQAHFAFGQVVDVPARGDVTNVRLQLGEQRLHLRQLTGGCAVGFEAEVIERNADHLLGRIEHGDTTVFQPVGVLGFEQQVEAVQRRIGDALCHRLLVDAQAHSAPGVRHAVAVVRITDGQHILAA